MWVALIPAITSAVTAIVSGISQAAETAEQVNAANLQATKNRAAAQQLARMQIEEQRRQAKEQDKLLNQQQRVRLYDKASNLALQQGYDASAAANTAGSAMARLLGDIY